MLKKHKSTKGITLVALIVTIIILLILAGISIASLTGSGLFERAREAEQKSKEAQEKEEQILGEYMNLINSNGKVTEEEKEKLPENSPDTEAGTIVKNPTNWDTETVKYIRTADGTEVTELQKVSTVYAVSVGNGETVPVPNGFYYVGGTLATGVVISDNKDDKYESGKDKTTYEYTPQLKGNQFVWIPCEESEYKKSSTWNGITQYYTSDSNYKLANSHWDTTTSNSEMLQIKKYGGFYVGRYEAGLATTITEFTDTQTHTGSNQIYNKIGIPQSKAGQIPWMFIDWNTAKANAESMYNNNYVSSGLITGTQWDVMLNKMVEKTDLTAADLTSSSSWGNHKDNAISYNGRLASMTYSSNTWYLAKFGDVTTGTTTNYGTSNAGQLLTTGASKVTGKYNIYDVAGNLWEWTEEASTFGGRASATQYRVLRGGSCYGAYATYPACFRNGAHTVSLTHLSVGFRTVLYIK